VPPMPKDDQRGDASFYCTYQVQEPTHPSRSCILMVYEYEYETRDLLMFVKCHLESRGTNSGEYEPTYQTIERGSR
jgi:hypothetical protein